MSGSRGSGGVLGTVANSDVASRAGRLMTANRGDDMNDRRLVGIDLGIASAHAVRVLDGQGTTLAKRKALPTVESLTEIETAALAGTSCGTRLEVVMEPTGPAWLPIAVFFIGRGHLVYRVSSAESADLRRYLSKHAKTNGIDADTLARIPLFNPAGVQPLELPGGEAAALARRVRAADRLTRDIADRKTRIKALVRQLMPMSPLAGKITNADLTVLERWADPNLLVRLGAKRLAGVITKASNGHSGIERANEWIDAASAALELYAGHPAVAFTDLAAEVATEVRLLRATQAELAIHASERETAYRWVDPGALARSLPGLAAPSPVWSPRHPRPATPTAKDKPCPRPARRCCARRSCAPRTPPANRTPSWRASTTCRWSSEARTISARSASWPPTSPNVPGLS